MHQEMLLQIVKATTDKICEYYAKLLEIIDNNVQRINEAAGADFLFDAELFGTPSTSVSNSDNSINTLLLLKKQIQEEIELCNGIAFDIDRTSDGTNYPRSGQNHAFYWIPEPMRATSALCQKASADVLNGFVAINETLNGLNQNPQTAVEFNMLHKMMSCLSDEVQSLHILYDQLAVNYRKMADAYAAADNEVSGSLKGQCDKQKEFDGDARQRALTEVLVTGGVISDSTSSLSTGILEQNSEVAISVPNGRLAGGDFCRVCGSTLSLNANYCSRCGSQTQIDTVELTKVNFSAIAPKELVIGEYALIEILMYENAFRNEVDRIITDLEVPAKETKGSALFVGKNAHIRIVLNSPDLSIDDNVEEQIWWGEYARFTFSIDIPLDHEKPQIYFIATVYINDMIATRLKFVVKAKSVLQQRLEIDRDDIMSAFVSYASQDRHRVAMIIQGMKKARPDMDIFFDVESLRSGDDWEKTLWKEIDKRDVLFLCWSHFAQESKWVEAEWRYALKRKGIDCIEPVPIDSPEVCPPPEELTQKHFNDKLLYIINSFSSS